MITDAISLATFASTKATHTTKLQLKHLPPDYAMVLTSTNAAQLVVDVMCQGVC
jgi:hypothetical protein